MRERPLEAVAMLRVLLVDDNKQRVEMLKSGLHEAGYAVTGLAQTTANLLARVRVEQPDAVIIGCESLDRDALEYIRTLMYDDPRPVAIFTRDGNRERMRAALKAGVSAYVVDGLSADRVRPVVDMAVARFQELQALRHELERANAALAERKLVERAKGILMKQRGCSEDEAYRQLRKIAMNRGKRLADVAATLAAAEDLFARA